MTESRGSWTTTAITTHCSNWLTEASLFRVSKPGAIRDCPQPHMGPNSMIFGRETPTNISFWIGAIANAQSFGMFHELGHKLTIDLLMDNQS